jgi:cytochrome c-type biogenesis protein CcmH
MQPDTAALLQQLAAHLEKNPRDSRAWVIFARMNFDRDDFAQARAAYARALALPGKVAEDPLVWCEYADVVALANGGRLAGEPRQHIEKALALNPGHPRALEMAGSAEIEQGNFRDALRYWEPLLKLLPPESPAHRELSAAVERTRMRAGL